MVIILELTQFNNCTFTLERGGLKTWIAAFKHWNDELKLSTPKSLEKPINFSCYPSTNAAAQFLLKLTIIAKFTLFCQQGPTTHLVLALEATHHTEQQTLQ